MIDHKLIQQLLLTATVAVCGLGVTFIREMSGNLQSLTWSVQELNAKMSQVYDVMKDHEQRLRVVETKSRR